MATALSLSLSLSSPLYLGRLFPVSAQTREIYDKIPEARITDLLPVSGISDAKRNHFISSLVNEPVISLSSLSRYKTRVVTAVVDRLIEAESRMSIRGVITRDEHIHADYTFRLARLVCNDDTASRRSPRNIDFRDAVT